MDSTRQLALTLDLAEVYLRTLAASHLSWEQMRAVAMAVEDGGVTSAPEEVEQVDEPEPIEDDAAEPLVSFVESDRGKESSEEVMIYGDDDAEPASEEEVLELGGVSDDQDEVHEVLELGGASDDQGEVHEVLELGGASDDLEEGQVEVVAFEQEGDREPSTTGDEDVIAFEEDDDLFLDEDDDMDGPIFEDGDDDTPLFEDESVPTAAAESLTMKAADTSETEVLALGAMTAEDVEEADVMVLGDEDGEVEVLAVEGLEAFEGEPSDDEDGGSGLQLQVHKDDPFDSADAEASAKKPSAVTKAAAGRSKAAEAKLVVRICKKAAKTLDGGDMSGAAEMYTDALDIAPDHIQALVKRARIYLDLGEFTRSMSDFARAESLAPANPEPHLGIGDLFFARKDYVKAIGSYDTAIEHVPEHAMAHCRRGLAWYYRKKYTEAVDDLTQAKALDESLPNIDTLLDMATKKARR